MLSVGRRSDLARAEKGGHVPGGAPRRSRIPTGQWRRADAERARVPPNEALNRTKAQRSGHKHRSRVRLLCGPPRCATKPERGSVPHSMRFLPIGMPYSNQRRAQHGVAVDRFARKIAGFLRESCAARSRQLNARPLGGQARTSPWVWTIRWLRPQERPWCGRPVVPPSPRARGAECPWCRTSPRARGAVGPSGANESRAGTRPGSARGAGRVPCGNAPRQRPWCRASPVRK
jgi:hypothetical protein